MRPSKPILRVLLSRPLRIDRLTDTSLIARSVVSFSEHAAWVVGLCFFFSAAYFWTGTTRRVATLGWDTFSLIFAFMTVLAIALGSFLFCSAIAHILFSVELEIENRRAKIVVHGLGRRHLRDLECLRTTIIMRPRFKSRGVRIDLSRGRFPIFVSLDANAIADTNGVLVERLSRITGRATGMHLSRVGSVSDEDPDRKS